MSLVITDTRITSDVIDAYAEYQSAAAASGGGGWRSSERPGRWLTRNQAITVMTIAEERARSNPNQALIDSLESELP